MVPVFGRSGKDATGGGGTVEEDLEEGPGVRMVHLHWRCRGGRSSRAPLPQMAGACTVSR